MVRYSTVSDEICRLVLLLYRPCKCVYKYCRFGSHFCEGHRRFFRVIDSCDVRNVRLTHNLRINEVPLFEMLRYLTHTIENHVTIIVYNAGFFYMSFRSPPDRFAYVLQYMARLITAYIYFLFSLDPSFCHKPKINRLSRKSVAHYTSAIIYSYKSLSTLPVIQFSKYYRSV